MAGYSVTFSVVDQATAQINKINKSIQSIKAPLEAQQKALLKFADVSGLTKVASGFKSIASGAAEAAEAMVSMVPAMGALVGAASLAGLAKLVNDFESLGDELTKTGMALDETPEKLYGVGQAMRYFGGNAKEALDALTELKNTTYDAALGMNAMAAGAFARAKIPIVDLNKNFRDTIDVQKDVFKYLDSLTNGMDRQRMATVMGGKALADTYQQYKLTGVTLDQWYQQQQKMETLTAQQVKSMREYEASVGPLNAALYDLGTSLATAVAPAFTQVFGVLTNWLNTNKGAITAEVTSWTTAFTKWVQSGDAKQLAQDFGEVAKAIEGVIHGIAKLMEWSDDLDQFLNNISGLTAYQKSMEEPKGEAVIQPYNPNAPARPMPPGSSPGIPSPGAPAGELGVTAPAPAGGGAPAPAAGPAPAAAPAPAAGPGGGGGTGEFIKGQEGAPNLTVGSDVGHPVIGYGHDLTPQEQAQGYVTTQYGNVDFRGGITKEQANLIFQSDYKTRADHLAQTVPGFGSLNPNQQEALTSYYYNVGHLPAGVKEHLAAGDVGAVAEDIRSGAKTAGGRYLPALAQRRQQEASLFMKPTAPTPDTVGTGNAPHTPGGGAAGPVVDQMIALAGTRGAAVREFLRDPSGKIKRDPDLGLWCAEFTGAYLQHLGIKGSGSLMAASYAQWGHQVKAEEVEKGDVLLNFNRKHVGVSTGRTRINPATGAFEVEEVSSNSLVGGQVTNLPGTRWRSDVEVRRSDELAALQAKGAPGTMMAGGAAPNGAVDINVRHSNPPPGVQVAALATGGGINLNPPRVEHQQMAGL